MAEHVPDEAGVPQGNSSDEAGEAAAPKEHPTSRIRTQRAIINAALFWGLDDFDRTRPQLDP